ncbi:MAG: nucleotidyltransferase family protein [Devosia sp.]|uniref:nucleotidyltransferase family protein n=1 Tax=Devosia sp. TaxID=1871048 RepID=UPI00261A7561|nr:nucleotidyltransferase family protein [Devosia sp.]MDB5528750.1 nucleotidyltransferase family protein [Devosia sp.]
MSEHLRYAGASPEQQRRALEDIVRAQPVLMSVLEGLRAMALPDAWLVSGAVYNMVWNHLTGRPALTGIKDVDLIYFDGSDLSYEAEDRVIKAADARFAGLPLPVELRNQARVHLWFPQKFGIVVTPLTHSTQSLTRYASRTHAVAARLETDDTMTIEAPFGLDDMFAFRITPNAVLDNRLAHETKGARAKTVWPEITVLPWPDPSLPSPLAGEGGA